MYLLPKVIRLTGGSWSLGLDATQSSLVEKRFKVWRDLPLHKISSLRTAVVSLSIEFVALFDRVATSYHNSRPAYRLSSLCITHPQITFAFPDLEESDHTHHGHRRRCKFTQVSFTPIDSSQISSITHAGRGHHLARAALSRLGPSRIKRACLTQ